MNFDELFWRRVIVSVGGLIYWGGVLIQGRRIRKRIKRSPNLKPKDTRERVLWAGWMLIIGLWIFQPLFATPYTHFPPIQIDRSDLNLANLIGGIGLTVAGYAATLWCYVVMGNAWRIGIDRKEKNELVIAAPYRWIRHPIYAFQAVMLIGGVLLVPTTCSLLIVVLHLFFVHVKAKDEEAYLIGVHGDAYRKLMARTGRLWPKLW